MRQYATILDIIEAGLEGNQQKVRAYTELLLERIQDDEDLAEDERMRDVRALQRVLKGRKGKVIYLADAAQRPKMVQDAITLFLETHNDATLGMLQDQFLGGRAYIEHFLAEMMETGEIEVGG